MRQDIDTPIGDACLESIFNLYLRDMNRVWIVYYFAFTRLTLFLQVFSFCSLYKSPKGTSM